MLRYRALAALFVVAAPAVAQQADVAPPEAAPEAALSPRNASYVIGVKLDPGKKMLEGRETVTWKNIQEAPTNELWFHLWFNGFRNTRSTWMLEDRLRGRLEPGARIAQGDWGWQVINGIKLLPGEGHEGADLTSAMQFVAADGEVVNPDDRTVVKVTLPRAVAPGESVSVEVAFTAKVPRTFARTGFRGDYFFLSHWYPALGVYEQDKGKASWNCHQFHAATEFFSDYGVYDVSMTVPKGWVVGATGRQTDRRDGADGTTYRHRQADVHNFAWTTSPTYQERKARFEVEGLPAVDMRLLFQPEHMGQVDRHFAATRAALENYGKWYGPYPYGHITIIDPAYGSRAGGMEYPTLFTAGTRLWNPVGSGSPEGVTIHEAGHQFWYGISGNNELEHAWLDEGLNRFSDQRAYDVTFGPQTLVRRYLRLPTRGGTNRDTTGFIPVSFPGITDDRMVRVVNGYRGSATAEVAARFTFQYYPPSAANITYSKTAAWLHTLERHLGWSTLQKILATHFERSKFRHPTPDEFFATANEVSGQDLGWFFDQVYRGSDSFDYAVESAVSKPAAVEGFVENGNALAYRKPGKPGKGGVFRSEVVVRRLGGGIFPVDVLFVFEDGSEAREKWDGKDRWHLFVFERPVKLKFAAVDPEHVLVLDTNYTNNSRLVKSADAIPVLKWSSKWMIWLQDLLATFAFFS